jgi:hypothetical protein
MHVGEGERTHRICFGIGIAHIFIAFLHYILFLFFLVVCSYLFQLLFSHLAMIWHCDSNFNYLLDPIGYIFGFGFVLLSLHVFSFWYFVCCLSCIASLLFLNIYIWFKWRDSLWKRRQKKPQHKGSTTKCSIKDSINKTFTKPIMLPLNKPSKPNMDNPIPSPTFIKLCHVFMLLD